MTDNDVFFKYYAEESLKSTTLERFGATKAAVERAAQSFGLAERPWEVGDIGCGAATQCALWARDGHRVRGVDINDRLIELGRARAAASGLPIELSTGSATALPWPDRSLDVCLCPELLEHVQNWSQVLLEAIRVIKPGGMLYLSTTNKLCPLQEEFTLPAYSWYPGPLKRRYERLAVTSRPELVNHARYPAVHWFTYFGLARFLKTHGLRCLDRFDVAALADHGPAAKITLDLVVSLAPVRWAAHVFTPYTMVFAQKGH
jgi:ubiquinone/menaquinone biosynthesis C-methylase UbiE